MGKTIVKVLFNIMITVMLFVAGIYLLLGCIYLVSDRQIGLLFILLVVYMMVSYIVNVHNKEDNEE